MSSTSIKHGELDKYKARFVYCNATFAPTEKKPDDELFHEYNMCSNIGSLVFAAIYTRPDIAFAVSYLARSTNHCLQAVCKAVVRIFQFLKGTFGIDLVRNDGAIPVVCYDANYAGDIDDCKPSSGILIGSASVRWLPRRVLADPPDHVTGDKNLEILPIGMKV